MDFPYLQGNVAQLTQQSRHVRVHFLADEFEAITQIDHHFRRLARGARGALAARALGCFCSGCPYTLASARTSEEALSPERQLLTHLLHARALVFKLTRQGVAFSYQREAEDDLDDEEEGCEGSDPRQARSRSCLRLGCIVICALRETRRTRLARKAGTPSSPSILRHFNCRCASATRTRQQGFKVRSHVHSALGGDGRVKRCVVCTLRAVSRKLRDFRGALGRRRRQAFDIRSASATETDCCGSSDFCTHHREGARELQTSLPLPAEARLVGVFLTERGLHVGVSLQLNRHFPDLALERLLRREATDSSEGRP